MYSYEHYRKVKILRDSGASDNVEAARRQISDFHGIDDGEERFRELPEDLVAGIVELWQSSRWSR